MESFDVIGLMSGTSLDGVDIALCNFYFDKKWHYSITHCETTPYSSNWKNILANLENETALNYALHHANLGKMFGEKINHFIQKNNISKIDAISSHGHTIFHQPQNNLTSQIGCGAQISATTGIQTICDFRTKDVALGGQGAPLVPIGDELLFSEYDYCLNLGGIANISFKKNGKRVSFDIGMANMVSNYLAQKENFEYDDKGNLAKSGNFNENLFNDLNNIDYFANSGPKSLGKEDFINSFIPLLDKHTLSNADKLHTFAKHLVTQISKTLDNSPKKKLLITGGGAFNNYWISELKKTSSEQIILPKKEITEYKEALIFAFLGLLRMKNAINCLSSVTGAKQDSIGGAIYT